MRGPSTAKERGWGHPGQRCPASLLWRRCGFPIELCRVKPWGPSHQAGGSGNARSRAEPYQVRPSPQHYLTDGLITRTSQGFTPASDASSPRPPFQIPPGAPAALALGTCQSPPRHPEHSRSRPVHSPNPHPSGPRETVPSCQPSGPPKAPGRSIWLRSKFVRKTLSPALLGVTSGWPSLNPTRICLSARRL